jgi:serine protease Do/serine protease DegQ
MRRKDKVMRKVSLVAASVLAFMVTAPVHTIPAKAAIPVTTNDGIPSLAPLIKKVAPSVVSIAVRAQSPQPVSVLDEPMLRQFLGLPEMPANNQEFSAGSGVVFDGRRGLIVTNSHVVENADQITVTLADGREVVGILQGSDRDTDIAVIKIALRDLPEVAFGNSDSLEVGDYVLAIGNPFGIGQTVTSGIVSGLRRTEMGLERYEDFIQTDASINPGNSGGALVNLRGEVVGINAALVGVAGGNAGIGFAIPINMVQAIADQLVKYGSVERGELGFAVAALRPDLSKKYNLPEGQSGAVVTQIEPNSAVERAGLRVGDLVTSLGSTPIKGATDLRNKLGLMRVGDIADITIWRNGKSLRIKATLSEPAIKLVQGDQLSPLLEGAMLTSSQTTSTENGLEVLSVKAGSSAWNSGLREGDVITSVNKKRVADFDRFAEEVRKAPERLILNVTRNGERLVLSINSKGNPPPKLPR